MSKAWRILGQLFSRTGGGSRTMGRTFGGLRDLWPTLGYRDTVDVEVFLSFYQRGDIAARIVDLAADTTWRFPPELRLEGDDTEGRSFLDNVEELNDRLGLWSKMHMLDRLSGIGRFGVMLIGARGDADQDSLAEPLSGLTSFEDVLFLKVFHEGDVTVKTWIIDEFDPRFGLPESYDINFNLGDTGSGKTQKVHWSRVIHVAENLVNDETYGTPRLERVINKLDDLNKLIGSAAEIFWLAVGGILHADIDPEVDVDPEDMEAFEKDLIEAMQGIRRIVQTRGVTLARLAQSGTVDPKPTYEAIVQLISATVGAPERVLFGSERGELASSQDQRQWHATIAARQNNHAEPVFIRAFFNRLADLGVKGILTVEYNIFWEPLDTPTELELAEIAVKKADAILKLAPGGQADILVPPYEARELLLGLPPVPAEPPEGAEEAFAEVVPLVDEPPPLDEPGLRLAPGDEG